jgi:hypothetical protein
MEKDDTKVADLGKASLLLFLKNFSTTAASVTGSVFLAAYLSQTQFIANNVISNTIQVCSYYPFIIFFIFSFSFSFFHFFIFFIFLFFPFFSIFFIFPFLPFFSFFHLYLYFILGFHFSIFYFSFIHFVINIFSHSCLYLALISIRLSISLVQGFLNLANTTVTCMRERRGRERREG